MKLMSDDFDEIEGSSCIGDGFWFRFDGRGVQGAVKAAQECLLFLYDLLVADGNDGGMKDGTWR